MLEITAPKIISAPKKYIKILLLSLFTEVVTLVKSSKKYFIFFSFYLTYLNPPVLFRSLLICS